MAYWMIQQAHRFVINLKRDNRPLPAPDGLGSVARFYGIPETLWNDWSNVVHSIYGES